MTTINLTAETFQPTIEADRILVLSQPGALPAPVLEDLIAQIRALDMDHVRESLASAVS